jgi:hypothetical protein
MAYDVTKYTDRLSAMRFFPPRPHAVAAIAETVLETCLTEKEADRLVAIMLERYNDWPGPSMLRKIHRDEIAPRRPREEQPDGCEHCRDLGGLRRVFQILERLPDGSERKHVIFPERDVLRAERELYERYRGNLKVQVYTSVVAPCSCALGRMRREELRNRDGADHDGRNK